MKWAWLILTMILTGLLLSGQFLVVMWSVAAHSLGLIDEIFWGLTLILLASVIFNIAWPSFAIMNGALFWDELIYGHTNLAVDLGRAMMLAVVLNVLLLAIFYARRRRQLQGYAWNWVTTG